MFRTTYPLFPTDDGWPYPDGMSEMEADDDIDLDALELRADHHVFDTLTSIEHDALVRRFGLDGPPETMKDVCRHLGCSHAEGREVLGRAIDKVRTRLLS